MAGISSIRFSVNLFISREPEEIERSKRAMLYLMEALVRVNMGHLLIRDGIPTLYKSGVLYRREGAENWKDIPTLMLDAHGDCEDLACWRVAELRNAGIAASPHIRWRTEGKYHALVKHPDGRIEDPSLALGMGGVKPVHAPVYIGMAGYL